MSDLSANISSILTQARDEIRANMASKGINASGRTSAALQVRDVGGKIQLFKEAGYNAPFSTLQYGRKAGGVPRGFFYIIQQWTRDKGFSFENEKNRNAFTAYVVNKVKTEGTNRYTNPQTDIYSMPIANAVERIKNMVSNAIISNVLITKNY